MLPLHESSVVTNTIVIRILSLLFCKPKDLVLAAKKRGIERAARIYTPILVETQEWAEQLKSKYSFHKDTFGSLIDKKIEYIKKIDKDILRYKEAYEINLKNEIEEYNLKSKSKSTGVKGGVITSAIGEFGSGMVGTMGTGALSDAASSIGNVVGGVPGAIAFLVGRLISGNGYIDRESIKKLEEAIIIIENESFDKAKVMWEKKISEHRTELDSLKSKGDNESRKLIELYDQCVNQVKEKEQKVAYYQERVGDLG